MLTIQYTDKYEIFYKGQMIGSFITDDNSAANLLLKASKAIKTTKSISKLSLS